MATRIKFKIITPERTLLEKDIDSLTVPTQAGEITVLPGHIPLAANLKAGELRIRQAEEESYFAISGGIVQVGEDNEVIILADTAEFGHEIDENRAEQAKELARKIMQDNYADEKASAEAVASLEKHLARLKVARRHRTKTNRNLESGTLHE